MYKVTKNVQCILQITHMFHTHTFKIGCHKKVTIKVLKLNQSILYSSFIYKLLRNTILKKNKKSIIIKQNK